MNIFSLIFFALITIRKQTTKVCFFSKVNQGLRVAYSRMILLKDKEHAYRSSMIFCTCTEILWSFFLFVKPLFSCGVLLSIWSLLHWKKSSLFIGETRELNLESPRFSWLIQRILSTRKYLLLFLFWLQLEDLFPSKIYQRENIYLFILILFRLQLKDLILFVKLNFVIFQISSYITFWIYAKY